METITAGWHPDPSGRHEWRQWDGQRWTDHVADGGVTSFDPLPPAPAQTDVPAPAQPSAEQVVLDTEVKAGLKGGRRLVVTDRALHDGGETFPFAAVTALNHCRTRVTTGSSRTMNYIYELWFAMDGAKPRRIYWSGFGAHEQQVFDAVVAALHRYVVPRLVADMVKRIAAGEVIEISGLLVSADGVARKKLLGGGSGRVIGWSPNVRVIAEVGSFTVIADGGAKPERIASVPAKALNAALVPALIGAFTR
jgi:hypothetical protein